MSNTSLPGSNRLKLIAVPVLAIVLISQLWPSKPNAAPAATSASPPSVPETIAAQIPTSTTPEPRVWPNIPLADLLQHNPFAVPADLIPAPPKLVEPPPKSPPPSSASGGGTSPAAKLVALESKRVTIVLMSRQGATAVVDSKPYHVNDYLEPGVQIAEIRPDAVILRVHSPTDSPPDRPNLPQPSP